VATLQPNAKVDGVHLQHEADAGQDVIIGLVQDPGFGPVIMFGSGGVEAEALGDVAFALPPLTAAEAKKLIERTWAGRRLRGYRSIAPADAGAVLDAIVRFSWLVVEHDEFEELEINPLRVLPSGVRALDVRVQRRHG
jgi:acetyltransferase